jgi:hypothetical protein
VKFGVSPFGIWQPGYPARITGMNAYTTLYCDSRKWLMNGWLDYCVPQLYWEIQAPEHSFPALLRWWQAQNVKGRHLWPGLDSGKTLGQWRPDEIVNQIKYSRDFAGSESGAVHWSVKSLRPGGGPLAGVLKSGLYAEQALVPASVWLEPRYFATPRLLPPRAMDGPARRSGWELPDKPTLKIDRANTAIWEVYGMDKVSAWVLQTKSGGHWKTVILPRLTRHEMLVGTPEAVALTAIDRCGVASPTTVLQRMETARK